MDKLTKRFPHYSKLLHIYPRAYRDEYGEQMLQTLADMLDNTEPSKQWRVWLRTSWDLPLSAIKQQLVYEGMVMNQQMPNYIKRNGVIGAWLVAPFFLFLFLNVFSSRSLNNSFFWHTRVLAIWLIVLPSIAIILNLAALLRWVHTRRTETKQNLWRTLIDVKYTWPTIAITLIGLGILGLVFGHDSVHCLSGNPVRELHNFRATFSCVRAG